MLHGNEGIAIVYQGCCLEQLANEAALVSQAVASEPILYTTTAHRHPSSTLCPVQMSLTFANAEQILRI